MTGCLAQVCIQVCTGEIVACPVVRLGTEYLKLPIIRSCRRLGKDVPRLVQKCQKLLLRALRHE